MRGKLKLLRAVDPCQATFAVRDPYGKYIALDEGLRIVGRYSTREEARLAAIAQGVHAPTIVVAKRNRGPTDE